MLSVLSGDRNDPVLNHYCVIDALHCLVVKTPNVVAKTAPIYRTSLFRQNEGVLCKVTFTGINSYMHRVVALVLCCDRKHLNGRTKPVPHIILSNQYGLPTSLLTAETVSQLGIENVSTFNIYNTNSLNSICCVSLWKLLPVGYCITNPIKHQFYQTAEEQSLVVYFYAKNSRRRNA